VSKRLAILPAFNEAESVGTVIDEIRAADDEFDVVVVDDGCTDAAVVTLPFNLGIGGAMQTGFRYAYERGYEIAVQVDADGQHDPTELPKILAPILAGEADLVVGSRFRGDARGSYKAPFLRRLGIRIFASVVSMLIRQKVTDTTSGFRAVNRLGIKLFAADYPHDYPEVEATVMVFKHRLRLKEVPVRMREREAGRSSIGAFDSVYYMVKVLLAIFISIFRRNAVPLEER
jgi:glycosyltransferase involved in cell wall biosynthesis